MLRETPAYRMFFKDSPLQKGGVDQDWVEGKLRWQERLAKLHQYHWELRSVHGWSELSSVGLKWPGTSVCLLQPPEVNCPCRACMCGLVALWKEANPEGTERGGVSCWQLSSGPGSARGVVHLRGHHSAFSFVEDDGESDSLGRGLSPHGCVLFVTSWLPRVFCTSPLHLDCFLHWES